ncbi:MAG: hypothetical protein HKN84_02330 [Gammaproteobacteria bacterium]|nr:hypothetical protein [Gammaproteobacteria bacterium]
MAEEATSRKDIPVLTDVITDDDAAGIGEATATVDPESLIAELQTQLASNAYALTEQLLHNAFAEMEATLFTQISARLREELPELIDRILREHLGEDSEEPY